MAGGQKGGPAARTVQIQYGLVSLDVKTAFDVAKPSVVPKILTLTGVHGLLMAEMQDVRGSACSENNETEFWYSRLETSSQVRSMESSREMESQRLGVALWRTTRQ